MSDPWTPSAGERARTGRAPLEAYSAAYSDIADSRQRDALWPDGATTAQMERLRDVVDRLRSAIYEHRTRLTTVLVPQPEQAGPTANPSAGAVERPRCDLAGVLADRCDALEDVARLIEHTTREVDL